MKFKMFFRGTIPRKKISDALCEVFLQIYIRMDTLPTPKKGDKEKGGPQRRNSPQKTNKNYENISLSKRFVKYMKFYIES